MRGSLVLFAALVLAACSKGREYTSGGEADTTADTSRHSSMTDISIGMKKDTVSIPTIGTVKDTIIVDRPVVGTKKKVVIERPTVDVKRKP